MTDEAKNEEDVQILLEAPTKGLKAFLFVGDAWNQLSIFQHVTAMAPAPSFIEGGEATWSEKATVMHIAKGPLEDMIRMHSGMIAGIKATQPVDRELEIRKKLEDLHGKFSVSRWGDVSTVLYLYV